MAEALNILHLSTYDQQGGAGRAAWRLHEGYQAFGHRSRMLARTLMIDADEKQVRRPIVTTALADRVRRRWRATERVLKLAPHQAGLRHMDGQFDLAESEFLGVEWEQELKGIDLINLHWVSRFLDWPSFFAYAGGKVPMLWTLHDMASFTGGCHHSGSCEHYVEGCHSCPVLNAREREDLSYHNWHVKRAALAHVPDSQLGIVTPSEWLAKRVRESGLFSRFQIRHIPNGMDLNAFAPLDRPSCRTILGVRDDLPLVLFSSYYLGIPNKGWHKLMQALAILQKRGVEVGLLLVGYDFDKLEDTVPAGVKVVFAEHISKHGMMQMCLNAADLTVVPSTFENLPCAIQESLACGTPCVGFAVGGIPEMLQPGINGLLAEPGNVEDLADKIIQLIEQCRREGPELRRRCRETAVARWSVETQVAAYLDFYADLARADSRLPKAFDIHPATAIEAP